MLIAIELGIGFASLVTGVFVSELVKIPVVAFQERYLLPGLYEALKVTEGSEAWQEVDDFLDKNVTARLEDAFTLVLDRRGMSLSGKAQQKYVAKRKAQFSFDKHREKSTTQNEKN